MYVTTLVAQAPYDVKGEELGHSHLGRQACGMCVELNIDSLDTGKKNFFAQCL